MNLIVGASGVIGTALSDRFESDGISFLGTSRTARKGRIQLDLGADPTSWLLPDGITTAFLCAAETRLQSCEADPSRTALVNVERTLDLMRLLVRKGAFIVYPSTNLVFDGSKEIFGPEDRPFPITEYGRQKSLAETGAEEFPNNLAIVRLTKVLHHGMKLFRDWKGDLLKGNVIRPFGNLFISPLSPDFVALALQAIAARRLSGIWHLSGDRQVSYAECALALATELGCDTRLVQPVDAPLGMARSAALNADRVTWELGLPPPNVADTLAKLFHSLP